MWSPTVAKHDHTPPVAGSRPASSAALHRGDAALQRLVGEERVEDHVVEGPPAEGERVRPEGDETQRDVLVEVRVEVQDRPRPGGPVVADDRLALPQPAHQPREVLHLGGGDAGHAVGVLHQRRCPVRSRA